jgi:hypothetical protein
MTYSALPGFYVDTIRNGVDNTELKTRGNSSRRSSPFMPKSPVMEALPTVLRNVV